ncbi:hypothetical protein AB0C02_33480 [Micromonospora sp. NPDC048999]|uniref:hypothetical protein n=1 Tax=Micromonospora sp. NPDC048999 TaxID=3155391 RepID=UPI0033FD353D
MTAPSHDPTVTLHLDEAEDLAHLLGQVEDWLRHTGGDTFDNLTEFFNSPGHGRLAAAGLVETLGSHAATLQRRLKEATR